MVPSVDTMREYIAMYWLLSQRTQYFSLYFDKEHILCCPFSTALTDPLKSIRLPSASTLQWTSYVWQDNPAGTRNLCFV